MKVPFPLEFHMDNSRIPAKLGAMGRRVVASYCSSYSKTTHQPAGARLAKIRGTTAAHRVSGRVSDTRLFAGAAWRRSHAHLFRTYRRALASFYRTVGQTMRSLFPRGRCRAQTRDQGLSR